MTPRELEVAALICRGQTTKAIAYALGISAHTVKAHRNSIYAKLEIHSQAELGVKMARSPIGASEVDR